MLQLLQFLNAISTLSGAEQQYLLEHLQHRKLRKGEKWLREGQVCQYVAFIEQGQILCQYKNGGRVFTHWLKKERDIFLSVPSFFKRIPSTEMISAASPATVFYINYEQWKYLFTTYNSFREITLALFIRYHTLGENMIKILRLPAAGRVVELAGTNPSMIKTIPGRIISAYLGISEQHYSILKKNTRR